MICPNKKEFLNSLDSILFKDKRNVSEADISKAAIPIYVILTKTASEEYDMMKAETIIWPYILPQWIDEMFGIDMNRIWNSLICKYHDTDDCGKVATIIGDIVEYYIIARKLMNSSEKRFELRERMGDLIEDIGNGFGTSEYAIGIVESIVNSVPEPIRPILKDKDK